MRARRAERCLQRASAALESGSIAEADAALAEARELDPTHGGLRELTDRLDALKHPSVALQMIRRGWPGLAAAFGLILISVGGWEVWKHREQIWTYESHLTPSIARMQPDVDKNSGLAAAGTTAAPGAVSSSSGGGSTDAIVNTQIIRPELVVTAAPTPPIATASLIEPTMSTPPMTATTGQGVGTAPNAGEPGSAAPITPPRAPEPSAPTPRDVVAPSLSYAAPSTLPATPATPIPSFIPSPTPPATDAAGRSSTAARATVDPSPSAAMPAPAAPSPAAPSTAREQSTAVRAALGKYEAAYNRLDVAAVRSVWPSIDQRALSRAFDSLTSQTVSLQNCTIDIIGATARASCSGRASWTPKIGGSEQSATRKWTFNLNQADGEWHIVQVQAR
jgi:hypothetical protein